MTIGYACLTVGVHDATFRTCRKDRATTETLARLIKSNLASLNNIFDYNIKQNIELFRISSDIIPFGSHPVNPLRWWDLFRDELTALGEKTRRHNMRLSMHPGQYTVLNSPREDVVQRAKEDLAYHTQFLDALGLDRRHKIVLHIGGAYGDKSAAIERFIKNYHELDDNIKDRLVIENDDKIFNIHDVLLIGSEADIPVIYDNLHNQVNPYDDRADAQWIEEASKTWRTKDGRQKVHYSQQHPDKKTGSHSETIDLGAFLTFYNAFPNTDVDIMLEVKDKNLSAVKCINAAERHHIKYLEQEWAKYKYLVLEHSPQNYQSIRNLLKDKAAYPVVAFYQLIDEALQTVPEIGHIINAGQHVWGYFKKSCDAQTKSDLKDR